MQFINLITLLVEQIGHLGLWCAIFNQVHATGLSRPLRKGVEKTIYVLVIAGAIGIILQYANVMGDYAWLRAYRIACVVVCSLVVLRWVWRKWQTRLPSALKTTGVSSHNLASGDKGASYCGAQARLLGMIPFNQSLALSVERRLICLDRWPSELNGLKIAHLSDLHLTGKVSRGYFEQLANYCNREAPDLVLISGDIVDKRPCLQWLPTILGTLKATHGKFFIRGNHDLRIVDHQELLDAVIDQGFEHLNGSWRELVIRGNSIYFAGDELPWYSGAETLAPAPGPSVLLAHSPDRVVNAARLGIDLVLAGHCHGGQIRIPLIGPVIAPSKFGIRFASGTFQVEQTLMHVTRGISADDPVRINCPPELNIMEIHKSDNGTASN